MRKSIVGDDPGAIGRRARHAAAEARRSSCTTGGLGPDRGRRDRGRGGAVARGAAAARRGLPPPHARAVRGPRLSGCPRSTRSRPTSSRAQRCSRTPAARRPASGPRGTGAEIVVLPGVPSEMREIMEEPVLPVLRERAGGVVVPAARPADRRNGRVGGRGAGRARLREVEGRTPSRSSPPPGEVQLHLCVRGEPAEADSVLAAMEEDFGRVLGHRLFGRDEEDLAAAVGRLLRDSGRKLALAESCTGGMISALVTESSRIERLLPGSRRLLRQRREGEAPRRVGRGAPRATARSPRRAPRQMARGALEQVRRRPRRFRDGDRRPGRRLGGEARGNRLLRRSAERGGAEAVRKALLRRRPRDGPSERLAPRPRARPPGARRREP